MSPKYLMELADIADPEKLWRLSPFDQMALPAEKRAQLNTGVALRRHASDEQRMCELIGTGKSVLLTPLSPNGRRVEVIETPASATKGQP